MRKHIILSVLAICSVVTATAQGTDALPFTAISRSPESSALAGSDIASSDHTAWSAFRNAAALPFSGKTLDAGVSYQRWAPSYDNSSHINAGVAYKFTERIGLSLGFAAQSAGSYSIVDDSGESTGTFRPVEMVGAVGFGVGLGQKFSLGINGLFALQKTAPGASYMGFSGNIMLMYRPIDILRITGGVATLGNSITDAKLAQPAHAVAGVEVTPLPGLKADLSAQYYFSGQWAAAAGVQYDLFNVVYLRAGYRYASAACVIPSHLALGLGVHFKGFRLEGSYITASQTLRNTFMIGLAFSI